MYNSIYEIENKRMFPRRRVWTMYSKHNSICAIRRTGICGLKNFLTNSKSPIIIVGIN